MKKGELVKLRKIIKEEIKRREEMNRLITNEYVIKYLNLIGESTDEKNIEDIRGMLVDILRNFKVSETNGIYVCTKAFDRDSHAPKVYYGTPERFSSMDYKCYKDIESGEEIETNLVYGPYIDIFERRHTVLNPYNAAYDDKVIRENGYEEVRLDFFEESYRKGQSKAVQMVLKKYPRI